MGRPQIRHQPRSFSPLWPYPIAVAPLLDDPQRCSPSHRAAVEAATYTRNLLDFLYAAGWLGIRHLSARSGIPYDALHDTVSGRRCPQLGMVERWSKQLTELAIFEHKPKTIVRMARRLDGTTTSGPRTPLLFADSGKVQVWPPRIRSWAALERLLWEPTEIAVALSDNFGLFELSCICQALEMRSAPFACFKTKQRDGASSEPQARLSEADLIDLEPWSEVYEDSSDLPQLAALRWIREHSVPYPDGERKSGSSLRQAALKNLRGAMAVEAQNWTERR